MDQTVAAEIRVYGIVQGIGFRPFTARLARVCGISGTVCNRGPFVEITAEGRQASVAAFIRRLRTDAPSRAAILKLEHHEISPAGLKSFRILPSEKTRGDIFVSPDIAICKTCSRELFDPANRRYLHPFINCTACGPRVTILDAMPYDRQRTSMKAFPMCEACASEYADPATRRYHAQPVCCNDCGPELYLLGEPVRGKEALLRTREVIRSGGIAAVKGIGGFHLCADAASDDAVLRLRKLKNRPFKPFAVMMRDLETVRRYCAVTEEQAEILEGPNKPILLLPKLNPDADAESRQLRDGLPDADAGTRQLQDGLPYADAESRYLRDGLPDADAGMRQLRDGLPYAGAGTKQLQDGLPDRMQACEPGRLSRFAAPDNPRLGVMLPYAPVQLLLFSWPDGKEMPDALIMTSGNAQDTPICMNDEEAARFLSPLCDTILSNDREIGLRADDSVMDWFDGEPYMVRRSRGYAPLPVMVTESRDWQTPEIAAGKNLRSNAEEAPEGIEEETPKSTAEEASGNAEEKTSKSAAEDVLKGAAVKDPGDIAEKVPKCTAVKAPGKVLGIGGELKNAFCLASEELYYLSPYIGNLTDVRGTDALESAVTRMEELLEIRPDRVVCDLHPGYMSSGTAKRIAAINGIPVEMVQHHHAHILSCMAENDCQEPVIGIAFDGTGYGSDGTVWGGEFLIADRSGFQRAGSIEPFTQTGGDLAPREGWRAAAALLMQGCHTKKMTADEPESGRTGAKLEEPEGRMIKGKTERPKTGMTGDKPDKPEAGMAEKMLIQLGVCTADELRLVRAMIQNGINAIPSSSAGRVFDAASAVLGLRRCSTSEGEASMVLQFAAEKYQKVIGNLPEPLQRDSLAEYARRIPLAQTQCSSHPDGRAGDTASQAQSSSLLQIPVSCQAQCSSFFQIPVSWLIRELAVRRQSRMPQKESGREDQLQQAESGRQGQIPQAEPGRQGQIPPAESSRQGQLQPAEPGRQEQILQAEPGRQGQIPQAEPSHAICRLAYEFHEAMAVLIARGAERCRDLSGLNTVALSGGVMQNTLLLSRCIKHLEDAGFRVLRHHMVPPNDGGIALGQAYYRP